MKELMRDWLGINADKLEVLKSVVGLGEDLQRRVEELNNRITNLDDVVQSISDDVGILIADVKKLKEYTGIKDDTEFMKYGYDRPESEDDVERNPESCDSQKEANSCNCGPNEACSQCPK